MARLMPSISEWRQPYLLSNFDLVTASLTLMAGNSSSPACSISSRRWTPVVVSSETPLMPLAIDVHRVGSSARLRASTRQHHGELLGVGGRRVRHGAGLLELDALVDEEGGVAAVVEDQVRALAPGQRSTCSVHHQYSSRVSPFQAKTGTPFGSSTVPSGPTATAAAAWSWVEKMLQLAQRTSAPRAVSVSIRTAVWMVMWSEPVMRAPARGCSEADLGPHGHQAGHLVLGQHDLLAAELGQGEVGDLEVGGSAAGHEVSFAVAGSLRVRIRRHGKAVSCLTDEMGATTARTERRPTVADSIVAETAGLTPGTGLQPADVRGRTVSRTSTSSWPTPPLMGTWSRPD